MKVIQILLATSFWWIGGQVRAQAGLRGEYYDGTNFERKVMTRIDQQLHFTWKRESPVPGLPRSYYSVRWTGKLLAPASGRYVFYAKVDDGIRLWIGNKKVMDVWTLNDSKDFTGSIVLQKGQYYDLRVDYFNAMLGGVIELFWERPDDEKPLFGLGSPPRTPVTAQYFRQAAPPKPVAASPKEVASTRSTPVSKPVRVVQKPKPVPVMASPPVVRRTEKPVPPTPPAAQTTEPVDEPLTNLAPGKSLVLPQVLFEQSSYVLLPGSTAELDRLAAVLKQNPNWRIEVAGHTDNVGDPRLNLALSENRARVVAHYLIQQGVADSRIDTRGYGGTRPMADNTNETERAKNRRVEIKVL